MSVTNVSRFLAAILFLTSSLSAAAQGGPFALTHANLFDGVNEKITDKENPGEKVSYQESGDEKKGRP